MNSLAKGRKYFVTLSFYQRDHPSNELIIEHKTPVCRQSFRQFPP
jgi:hypothetical protein